ncbi:Rho guanine nucleotide exchange factor 1 [Microtus ochrogaster]|uniref:Rho guanine nucleotide exchange factor 1 n=1 Tax=Microtus ochrogaster TaxID=79684 RepID=A0A8J6G0Z1_MICOH|nr:Rho guanine nucleotide exchange factor 1 [Microtus ochrogaster]
MLSSLGPKEAKKAFLDFYHSFLEKTAVLRVPVPPNVAFELDRTRPDLISEDVQRRFMQEVVQSQQAAVSRQLEDFRSKRLMGMTPWEQELSLLEPWIGKDRSNYEARERHVAERLLSHLEEMHAAVVTAISLYMRHLGVRTKSGDKKSGRNFFRKKVMGNRWSDEPPKTKKGLSSILDPARWNRGEPAGKRASLSLACSVCPSHSSSLSRSFVSAPDFRHLKVEVDGNGLVARVSIVDLREEVWACTPGSEGGGLGLEPWV